MTISAENTATSAITNTNASVTIQDISTANPAFVTDVTMDNMLESISDKADEVILLS